MNKIKAIMSNNCLTVVLSDGTMLVNNDASIDLFNKVRSTQDEDQIIGLMAPELSEQQKKEREQREEVQKIVDGFDTLVETGDFEIEDGCVYIKGIKRTLPKELVQKFIQVVENEPFNRDEYHALKNFWYWLVINPNSEAVEGTFEFINRKDFKVTRNGFLLAYRWVVSKGVENQPLVDFVSNQYIKIKTRHKKNPANYTVWKNLDSNEFSLTKENILPDAEHAWIEEGNLKDLYLELPSLQEDTFTDGHTKQMSIVIGQEVSMDRKLCDEYRGRDCSRGLHAARDLADYSSHGDTALLVAINPMNIVSVPESNSTKMRCCAYMPLAVLGQDDHKILDDADTIELIDEYTSSEIEKLETLAKSSTAQDLKKNYIISDIKQISFSNIIHNLSELKIEIEKRVIKI